MKFYAQPASATEHTGSLPGMLGIATGGITALVDTLRSDHIIAKS
jgi:hypothetical protein